MALITAAQFRQHYAGLTGTDEDTLVDALIARVDALIAAYCGHPLTDGLEHTLEVATYTEYLEADPRDPRILRVSAGPLVTVTSVHVDPLWTYAASELVTSSDYVLVPKDGTIHLVGTATSRSTFSEERRANKVVYTAGYAAAPKDLIPIVALAVRDLIERGRGGGDALSVSTGGRSMSRSPVLGVLSPAVADALHLGGYVRGARGS